MYKRKKYVLDKKFQLKTTFSIVGISSAIVAIIIIIISINIAGNNEKLGNIVLIENNVVEGLLTYTQVNQTHEQKLTIKRIADRHYNNIDTIKNIIEINNLFLLLILIIAVIQSIVLYFILIRKTHKISGPIYVISKYIEEIIKGKYPEVRPLRKNDEFKHLNELVKQMVDILKNKI